MKRATQQRFYGFGGHCATAALIINDQFFNNQGMVIGAFNKAFADRGRYIGHVAVMFRKQIWDTEFNASPKLWRDIDTWGTLDPHDSDYIEDAAKLGFEFTETAAHQTIRYRYPSKAAVQRDWDIDEIAMANMAIILRDAIQFTRRLR
jgi:hypothetical protein